MFRFGFVFVKPRAVPPIFCLNVQTDFTTATLGTLQTNYLNTPDKSRWVSVKIQDLFYLFVSSFRIFRHLSNNISFQWVFFTEMLSWPHMLKQDLAGFIRGNRVIRLQSAEGGRCDTCNQFARPSKRQCTARGFTNTKSNQNMSISDYKWSLVHTYQ